MMLSYMNMTANFEIVCPASNILISAALDYGLAQSSGLSHYTLGIS